MSEHRVSRALLFWPKLPLKDDVQSVAGVPFIANRCANAETGQRWTDIIEAATRQTDVVGVILRTSDHTRLVVRRQPHRLRSIELGILKRGEPKQPVSKTWMQPVLADVDLIGKNQFQR